MLLQLQENQSICSSVTIRKIDERHSGLTCAVCVQSFFVDNLYQLPKKISNRCGLFREQTNEKVSLEGWQIGKTNSRWISEEYNSALIFTTDSSLYRSSARFEAEIVTQSPFLGNINKGCTVRDISKKYLNIPRVKWPFLNSSERHGHKATSLFLAENMAIMTSSFLAVARVCSRYSLSPQFTKLLLIVFEKADIDLYRDFLSHYYLFLPPWKLIINEITKSVNEL